LKFLKIKNFLIYGWSSLAKLNIHLHILIVYHKWYVKVSWFSSIFVVQKSSFLGYLYIHLVLLCGWGFQPTLWLLPTPLRLTYAVTIINNQWSTHLYLKNSWKTAYNGQHCKTLYLWSYLCLDIIRRKDSNSLYVMHTHYKWLLWDINIALIFTVEDFFVFIFTLDIS
jgi:hypothetical protein